MKLYIFSGDGKYPDGERKFPTITCEMILTWNKNSNGEAKETRQGMY